MIDWSVNLGNLIQIAAFLGGGLAMWMAQRSDIRILRHDVGYIEDRIHTLNEAFTQLGQILTQVAVQDSRLNMIERGVDELRHGQGFVRKDKD